LTGELGRDEPYFPRLRLGLTPFGGRPESPMLCPAQPDKRLAGIEGDIGAAPSLRQRLSVKQRQRDCHDEEQHLVERAWNRCDPQRGEPSKRPWDALVRRGDPDSPNGSPQDAKRISHQTEFMAGAEAQRSAASLVAISAPSEGLGRSHWVSVRPAFARC
jgi:hypothetical protein